MSGKHLPSGTVSRAATRGQKLIVDQFLSLKDYKRAISTPPVLYTEDLLSDRLEKEVYVLKSNAA